MAGARRESRPAPQRLILDAGAVLALARGEPRGRAFLARALALEAPVEIPVVVMAETVLGGARDAPRAEGGPIRARRARGPREDRGTGLLAAARPTATADALVVAQALEAGGAHILTGEREDLERLAAPHPEVWVHAL
jgi:predicted nucleic acid-binding protein